jgi:DNA repair photolyase
LETKNPKRVLLGSTTECFQQIEKKYKITEQILGILNRNKINYTILTKSSLIKDYLELISKNEGNEIYYTLNLAPQKIINIFEKNSSPLSSRLDTIKRIIKKNIVLRIHIGPFIPYLTDLEKILDYLPQEANQINVELYHNKMGNFDEILKKTRLNFDNQKNKKILSVYSNKANYQFFANQLRNKIIKIKRKRNINFFYIVPDYNQFYKPVISYNEPLK